MKTLLSLLLLAICVSGSFAQVMIGTNETPTSILVNRLDSQTGQRWEHVVSSSIGATGATNTPVLFDKERNLQTPANHDESFSIHFPSQVIEFKSGTIGNIKAHLVNNTDDTLHLVFRRWQSLPNESWNSSVCFGDLCYIYLVDSLPWSTIPYYEFLPHAEAEFKLAVYAPKGADDSMGAYIRIQALNTPDQDTVGFFVAAKATPQSSVGQSDTKLNFKIQSIYPSPLVSGSALKVKLTAPENAGYSYTVFDNLGREVAFGSTRQQLLIGDNTVEISSLEGLVTGSYLLRIKFNGGGSDAIPFQVIR
jgi:hypothetical protein